MIWGRFHLLYWLPLALPLAWMLFALLRRRRRALEKLVNPAMLPVLAPAWNPARATARLGFRLGALVLLFLALARPSGDSTGKTSAAKASISWSSSIPRAR